MARKKREDEVIDDLDGTVEGQAREHFEREKKAYEERTGETVEFVPPVPVTRTPVKSSQSLPSDGVAESEDETGADATETEGEGEN